MTYKFKQQLAIGEANEAKLDEFFAQWYRITPAVPEQQRRGIDRIFTRLDTGEIYSIEYKTDFTAAKTGNAFVETVSVDEPYRPGWAHTSVARFLLYYIPGNELIYVIRFAILRRRLDAWKQQFPTRSIPNQGYNTIGLLVPLNEFERIAQQVISF